MGRGAGARQRDVGSADDLGGASARLASRSGLTLSYNRVLLSLIARLAPGLARFPLPSTWTKRHWARCVPASVHLLLRPVRPYLPALQSARALPDRRDWSGQPRSHACPGARMRPDWCSSRQLRSPARGCPAIAHACQGPDVSREQRSIQPVGGAPGSDARRCDHRHRHARGNASRARKLGARRDGRHPGRSGPGGAEDDSGAVSRYSGSVAYWPAGAMRGTRCTGGSALRCAYGAAAL